MDDLKTDPIGKLIWSFTLPSLLGTLANTLYKIIDWIFIGQSIGPLAISGLALTFPIMNILSAFGMLVGIGTASEASIRLGRADGSARKALPNMIYLAVFNYLLVTIVCYTNLEWILQKFGGTDATIPYASEYLRIIIPGHILTSLSYGLANLTRASGKPNLAMMTLVAGAAINILLDPLFIFVFGMGIKGAAIATLLSMGISSAWAAAILIRSKDETSFSKAIWTPDFEILGRIISIGMAPFLLQICNSLVNIEMNTSLQRYGGDLAIGAFGIITSYTALITMTIVGLANGLQPIIGYNYGAGQHGRVWETLRKGILAATVISLIGWAVAMLIPGAVARCFSSDDSIFIGLTANGLRFYCVMLGLVGFHIIVTNFYQSIGKAQTSVILTLLRQVVFLIPFILVFPRTTGSLTPLNALWLTRPAATLLAAAACAIWLWRDYRTYKKETN